MMSRIKDLLRDKSKQTVVDSLSFCSSTMDIKFPISPYAAKYFVCKTGCICSDENFIRLKMNDFVDDMVEELTTLNCVDSLLSLLQVYVTPEILLSPKAIRALVNSINVIEDKHLSSGVLDILKIHNRFHPPCKKNMRDYYEKIFLEDKSEEGEDFPKSYYFKNLISDIEEINFKLFHSVENISNRKIYSTVNKEEYKTLSSTRMKRVKLDKPVGLKVRGKNKETLSPTFCDDPFISLIRTYAQANEFSEIPTVNKKKTENITDKADRLFAIFDWMLDILEQDLYIWLINYYKIGSEDVSTSKSWPLIAVVAWEDNISSIGSVNNHCRQVFAIFKNCSSQYNYTLARYISLLSEVVRISEDNEGTHFPYFGPKCEMFSKEISEFISNDLSDEVIELVELLSPHWLKYIVSSYLLEASLTSETIYSLKSVFQLLLRNLTNREHQPAANSIKDVDVDNKENKPRKKVNKKNHIGETLVHKLCRNNDYEKLEKIIQCADVDVNIKDNCGWSALHEAVRCNAVDCVQLLINYRYSPSHGGNELNINIRSDDGLTPLMVAVNTANIDIINLLLNHGAGPAVYIRCNSGQTALDLAENNEKIKNLLLTTWNFTTNTYEYLNMSDRELKIFLNLVISYFKTYQVKNVINNDLELDNISAKFKEDCLYLDKLSTLVDRLTHKETNISLKILSLFLKSKLKKLKC